jgi:hypothetical protein
VERDVRTAGYIATVDGLSTAMSAISEICEGVAADVFIVDQGKAARATLATHGWTTVTGVAWQHASGPIIEVENGSIIPVGFPVETDCPLSPAVVRAFATLAQETRP